MSYNYFAPNSWFYIRTPEQKAEDAMIALRKHYYGLDYYKLDLGGHPLTQEVKS